MSVQAQVLAARNRLSCRVALRLPSLQNLVGRVRRSRHPTDSELIP